MKEKILILLSIFSASFALDFSLMLKGGINLGTMRGGYIENMEKRWNTKPRVGFVGGVGAQVGIVEKFAIQPEVIYSQKGIIFTNDQQSNFEKVVVELTNIDIPLLFKLRLPQEKIVINFYVGPQLSINLDDAVGLLSWEWDGESGEELYTFTELNTLYWGGVFGGGIELPFGKYGFALFDLRYNLGMSSTVDYDEISKGWAESTKENMEEFYEAKTGGLEIMIGYGFNF